MLERERELARAAGDLGLAEQALAAIRAGIETLRTSPFTGCKSGQSPFMRELIVPFARCGCVALFEIVNPTDVVLAALRHQLEDDYH